MTFIYINFVSALSHCPVVNSTTLFEVDCYFVQKNIERSVSAWNWLVLKSSITEKWQKTKQHECHKPWRNNQRYALSSFSHCTGVFCLFFFLFTTQVILSQCHDLISSLGNCYHSVIKNIIILTTVRYFWTLAFKVPTPLLSEELAEWDQGCTHWQITKVN